MNFKEKLRQFMVGHYGGDGLNTVLSVFSLISFITAMIIRHAAQTTAGLVISIVLYVVALGAMGLSIFRIFSKDLSARRAEYEWYRAHVVAPLKRMTRESKTRREQAATHKFFKCPKCRQTVRVPKGKGKIRITCPKCGEVFIKKT